ncbi:MAG: hypothetical protein ACTSVY_05080, partial [Candidatus Helarchaeota archaeon]
MPSNKQKMATVGLVVLLIAFSGMVITNTTRAQYTGDMFPSMDPTMFGGLIGGMFVGDLEGMGEMFNVMFNNATDLFNNQSQYLPNTYVYYINDTRTLSSWTTIENVHYAQVYNETSGGNPGFWVESTVNRQVQFSGTRTYMTVFIFWDPDNSLADFIKLIAESVEALQNGDGDMTSSLAVIANLIGALMNFNSVFTGDEVFTLASFVVDNFNVQGNYQISNQWYNNSNPNDPFDKSNPVSSVASTDLDDPSNPLYFYTQSHTSAGYPAMVSFEDHKAYQMWMMQLHIRNLHIGIDFSKLQSGDPLQIFKDVNIGFDIMTHRVTGLHIFNDTNGNGQLDLRWVYNSSYSESDPYGQSADINASETKYNYNIKDFDNLEVITPHVDGNTIAFGMNMSGVKGTLIPFGTKEIDNNMNVATNEVDANISQLTHIVHFEPTTSGNPMTTMNGQSKVKIDHVIGNWTVNGYD